MRFISIKSFILCIIMSLMINVFASLPPTYYGPIKANDTLWNIALQITASINSKENDISIEQTMLALLEFNKDSFVSRNVNALKPGSVLRVPSIDKINTIDAAFAWQEIQEQNQDWEEKHSVVSAASMERKAKKQATQKSIATSSTPTGDENIEKDQKEKVVSSEDNLGKSIKDLEEMKQKLVTTLALLEYKNNILQKQILDLNNKVIELDSKVNNVIDKSRLNWPILKSLDSVFGCWKDKLGSGGLAVLIIGFFSGLFFLLRFIVKGRRSGAKTENFDNKKDNKDDYDFMSSDDGIPSKINLAHAYLDMGNKDAAQEILQEVVVKGNLEQRKDAKDLLDKISAS